MKISLLELRRIVRAIVLEATPNQHQLVDLTKRTLAGDRESFIVLQDALEQASHKLAGPIRGEKLFQRLAALATLASNVFVSDHGSIFLSISDGLDVRFRIDELGGTAKVNPDDGIEVMVHLGSKDNIVGRISDDAGFKDAYLRPNDTREFGLHVDIIYLTRNDNLVLSDGGLRGAYSSEQVIEFTDPQYDEFRALFDQFFVPVKKVIDEFIEVIS